MKRMTRQRAALAEILAETADFRSAQQIHDLACEQGETIGLATVYRTLQALAEQGEVDVLRGDDGEALYRQCVTTSHHHHLVCRNCGATVELDAAAVEAWAQQMGADFGFTKVEHTVELFGLCRRCSRNSQSASGPSPS